MTDLTIDQTCLIVMHPSDYVFPSTEDEISLLCSPIEWKENQDCDPAIRDVPTADSQFMDTDTYVLKPRTLDFTIRLTDREKKKMDALFEYVENYLGGDNDFYVDIYLFHTITQTKGWHYKVFFTEKHYDQEYVIQKGRFVRWWKLKISCDVKDFDYSRPQVMIFGSGEIRIDGGAWVSAGMTPHFIDVGDHTIEFNGSGVTWTGTYGCLIDSSHETDNPVIAHIVGFGVIYEVHP